MKANLERSKLIRIIFSDCEVICSECGFLGLGYWKRHGMIAKEKHENVCDGTVKVCEL